MRHFLPKHRCWVTNTNLSSRLCWYLWSQYTFSTSC